MNFQDENFQMLTKEHMAMGGREGEQLLFYRLGNCGSFPPSNSESLSNNFGNFVLKLKTQICPPGNFGLELDADLSSGRSSGDIDTFLCIQMTKVDTFYRICICLCLCICSNSPQNPMVQGIVPFFSLISENRPVLFIHSRIQMDFIYNIHISGRFL